jgi:hypothetical protein
MARVFLVVALSIGCLYTEVYAQRRKTVRSNDDVRISTKHPTVYITFERVGKREPRRSNESNRGVWLRLHNNTRWGISVRAYGVPNLAFTDGKAEEVGLFYDVDAWSGLAITVPLFVVAWASRSSATFGASQSEDLEPKTILIWFARCYRAARGSFRRGATKKD